MDFVDQPTDDDEEEEAEQVIYSVIRATRIFIITEKWGRDYDKTRPFAV